MKIAIFVDTFAPKIDGVTTFLKSFVKYFSKDNEIMIITLDYTEKEGIKPRLVPHITQEDGATVLRIPGVPIPANKEVKIPVTLLRTVNKKIKEFDPDIMHINSQGIVGLIGVRNAKKLNKPSLGVHHTNIAEFATTRFPVKPVTKAVSTITKAGAEKIENRAKKAVHNFSNLTYEHCDVIVTPTQLWKDELLEMGINAKLVVISNGIETELFKPLDVKKNIKQITTVSRMASEKRVELLVEMFALLVEKDPEYRFKIVGGGPVLEKLKHQVKHLKLESNVEFTGFVNRDDLPQLICESSIFLTASKSDTQSLTSLEAMSCGLPVIAFMPSGAGGMINDGYNGFVVGEKNYEGMVGKIIELTTNESLIEEMSKNAREYALTHAKEKVMEKYKRLMEELISNRAL